MINTLTKGGETLMNRASIGSRLKKLYYERIIDAEIALCGIDETTRVLFIGGGAHPYSAYRIHEKTGAAVVTVDNRSKAVDEANRWLVSTGENSIRAFHAEGTTVDPGGFDVILVAKQVYPKEDVLTHVLANKDDDAIVCVRTSRRHLLPPSEQSMPVKKTLVKSLEMYRNA